MLLLFFPKKKDVFWSCLSWKCRCQILHIPRFFFPLIISIKGLNETVISVTFYFIFCGMAVFFLGMRISNVLVHHIWNSSLMSQFHGKVSKIDWNLVAGDANWTCIGRDTVCFYYLLESNLAWNWHSETVALFVDSGG